MWVVLYRNIGTWEHEWAEYETKEEAIEFANERLEIQEESRYLSKDVFIVNTDSFIKEW
jgi:hypothetical protein